MPVDPQKLALLEAVLFTTSNPLTFNEIQKQLKIRKNELDALLAELRKRYEGADHGITLAETGGYRLMVKPAFMQDVAHLTPHADLSRGLLRVLSIIAHRQPIRQSDIVKVVGNRTYDYVKELEERGLIKTDKKSRTKILTTTPHFDEYFGAQAEELKKSRSGQPVQEKKDVSPDQADTKPNTAPASP